MFPFRFLYGSLVLHDTSYKPGLVLLNIGDNTL